MDKFKSILNSQWFFPLMVVYYGIFYTIFGETYPKMLSIDGNIFMAFVTNIKSNVCFDTYYVYRTLPSLVIRFGMTLLGIDLEFNKIFKAFQVLNFISIAVACYYLKQIFNQFKIKSKNQVLGLILFVFNFAIIKSPFYMPVMTDLFALMLCTMLLYFYVKNNTVGVLVCTLFLAFTWPVGFYQGLLLIAFPFSPLPYTLMESKFRTRLSILSVVFIVGLSVFMVYVQNIDIKMDFSLRIDKHLLLFTIFGIALMWFFFVKILFNGVLFDLNKFKERLNWLTIFIAIGVFIIVQSIVYFLKPGTTPLYTTEQMLRDPIMYALARPFISIISDVSYFGVVICLVILFWNSFSKFVSQLGWGLVAAMMLDLLLFGVTTQSRHLVNLLPWIIVFLMKSINKYSFSNGFYIIIGLLTVFVSQFWFVLNNYEAYPPMQLDKDGCMGFPHQKFFMHFGPWMSEDMYLLQGGGVIAIIFILFSTLYRVETKSNKLQIIAKFK